MSPRRSSSGHLVTCADGSALDGMISGQGFRLQIKNNPKGVNQAGLCKVRIIDWVSKATLVDISVEFTKLQTIVHDDMFDLDPGIYCVDALYYDKDSRLSYDKYFLLFTVFGC
ncbi:hypothetical protein ANO14919_018570 [Xylariales sp. No.14919]|nr:hypothetical protein ANO14919_018570 [Xylariales sp. No.14919]